MRWEQQSPFIPAQAGIQSKGLGPRFRGDERSFGSARPVVPAVMPGLVPGIHALQRPRKKDVDGRDKPGHDELYAITNEVVP
jgi:hypothetical protein